MGYLYYGNYAQLYEIGRVEMLRDLGFPYVKMEDQLGIMLPVAKVTARYLLPAYYDELLTIESSLKEIPTKLITVHTKIYNEKSVPIHSAEVTLFFIDMKSNKRVSAPIELVDKLKEYF